jgi:hypothetical protein
MIAAAVHRAVVAAIEANATLAAVFGSSAATRRIFREGSGYSETPQMPYLLVSALEDQDMQVMGDMEHARTVIELHLFVRSDRAFNPVGSGFNIDATVKLLQQTFRRASLTDSATQYYFSRLRRIGGFPGPVKDSLTQHHVERYSTFARRIY